MSTLNYKIFCCSLFVTKNALINIAAITIAHPTTVSKIHSSENITFSPCNYTIIGSCETQINLAIKPFFTVLYIAFFSSI